MRDYDWFVDFKGDEHGVGVVVSAGSEEEAVILAKAHRIKSGLRWREVVGARRGGVSSPRRRRRNPLA